MAYKVIILYRLYMPFYFLGTFTEYPKKEPRRIKTPGSSIHNEDCLLQKLNGSASNNQNKPNLSEPFP